MTQAKKVILAFSGGLDTCYCAKYLSEDLGLEVISVTVDTGGFSQSELDAIAQNAKALGAESHHVIDESNAFYEQCIRFLIASNVLRNNCYPLCVSAERIFQATAIARFAREVGADYIAHGCTGAGNDQVRFDTAFNIICPDIPIIAPIREKKLSRAEEIAYLQGKGVKKDWQKAAYSINKGLWGTSVGGVETLTSDKYLPESAFPTPVSKTQPEELSIEFSEGQPIGLNGEVLENPVAVIKALTAIAAPFGIGRDIHVGDTILGIKGRVGFEAAAPMIILKAHYALEKHVLTKQQLTMKDNISQQYGQLVHEGVFLEPAMRDMEEYFISTQRSVTGKVGVHLAPYRFQILGVESKFDLMKSDFGVYGEMNKAWAGEDVVGFAKIRANQSAIYYRVHNYV